MALLKIKNLGPIKNGYSQNNGFMEIKPVTVICGNQATGKSTIAKVYSSLAWLEKKLDAGELSKPNTKSFLVELLAYHRIDSYLTKETEIEYQGNSCNISYSNSKLKVTELKDSKYIRPKIVYIPAERNFCTSIPNATYLNGLARETFGFLSDYMIAANSLNKNRYKLPLNGYEFRYDKKTNTSYISDQKTDYEIDITCASSGLQSISPMALTSAYYSQLISDNSDNQEFSFEQKKRWEEGMSKIANQYKVPDISVKSLNEALAKYRNNVQDAAYTFETEQDKKIYEYLIRIINSRFINVVEEPEQNLYPNSQSEILFYLLQCFNNQSYNTTEKIENQLLITTHSPYILSYLTLSAKAAELLRDKRVPAAKIENIIPVKATVDGDKVAIYQTKSDGTIELLEPYENLPSDDNELNKILAESNDKFSDLLDLEVKFCR